MNHYSVDSMVRFIYTYPLDSDLLRSRYQARHSTLGEALRDDPNNGCEGD